MKLRLRLLLTTAAATAPLVAALYLIDARARHHAAERLLTQAVRHHLQAPGERERCEASPESWGGEPLQPPRGPGGPPPGGPSGEPPHADHRPGGAPPVLHAFSEELRAANPSAPALPPALADGAARADVVTLDPLWPGSSVDVLLRAPWREGPCAWILAHGTTTAGWFGARLPADPLWLVPALGVMLAMTLAAGPAVRRIKRLADRVRRSADSGFAEPVRLDGDDEVAELSRAFDRAAALVRDQLQELQRRERTLREFVSNTTHDVMTPLTVLADHLTTLGERPDQPPDPTVLSAATDELHYVASIIENLALAAKLEAGAPTRARAPVELNALVARVLARHRVLARARGVALEGACLEEPAVVDADLTMLEQAVSNLVHNAVRYNERGGHVAVLLERPRPDRVRLRVVDDGPGIPDDAVARLVQRGARGDAARTREPGGQGLGLAIAFRVAALHDMTLELSRSEYGGLQVELGADARAPS